MNIWEGPFFHHEAVQAGFPSQSRLP